jgi:hypothetical protein
MIQRAYLLQLLFALAVAPTLAQTTWAQTQSESKPTDAVIKLREQGYELSIFADGAVAFEAQTFQFDVARVRSRITQKELNQLVAQFQRIEFFALRDRYLDTSDGCPASPCVDCNHLISLAFSWEGKRKTIAHDTGTCRDRNQVYPAKLAELEQKIVSLVNLKPRPSPSP